VAFTGLYSTLFAAPDMKEAQHFYTDWGLRKVKATPAHSIYETKIGSRVELKSPKAEGLPLAAAPDMHFREMIWGVSSKKHLAKIKRELSKDREVIEEQDGTLHCTDPNGLGVGFKVWKPRTKIDGARTKINSFDIQERVDEISTFYKDAHPIRMGHIGFVLPDLKAAEKFYKDRLGFWLSDRYGKAALFLRCSAKSQHHNLFMIWSEAGNISYHHTAFEVRDIHEVFGGGVAFDKKGWATEVGPGRHPISSAYFWYFKAPCGGAIEYFTDSDYLTENWKPHNYRNNLFSEWHLPDGIKQVPDGKVRPSVSAAGKH